MVEVDGLNGADTGGFQAIIVEVKDQGISARDPSLGGGEEIGDFMGDLFSADTAKNAGQ